MTQKVFRGCTAKIFIDDLEIGYVKSANITITEEIESYYGIEDTSPHLIEGEGTVKIEGSLTRAWVNTYYLTLLGIGSVPFEWKNNKEFDLVVKASEEVGSPTIYLYNCRFTKGHIGIPQNGFLDEEYDFMALSSGEGEVPTPIVYRTVGLHSYLDPSKQDEGTITVDVTPYGLPNSVVVPDGSTHSIFYTAASMSYEFDHWTVTGDITLVNAYANPTNMTVYDTGMLTAIFKHITCPTGEQVINGGFEIFSSPFVFPPWITSGFNITGGGHSGSHCIIGNNGYVEQSFSPSIPVACVSKLEFYALSASEPWVNPFATCRIYYDDGTYVTQTFPVGDFIHDPWTKCNMLPYLTAGKKILKVRLSTVSMGGQGGPMFYDDVSLVC